MGYQESVIFTENPNDFNKLVKRVKELGKDYYEGCGCKVCFTGNFKKNINTLFFPNRWMGDEFTSFKPIKGTPFIYAAGDRTLQYDVRNFINKYYPCFSRSEYGTSGGWEEGDKIDFDFTPIMVFIEKFPKSFLDETKPINDGYENKMIRLEDFKF